VLGISVCEWLSRVQLRPWLVHRPQTPPGTDRLSGIIGRGLPAHVTSASRNPRFLNSLQHARCRHKHHTKKTPPHATLSAPNVDLNTVTIAFTAHSVTMIGNRCCVSLRGQNPYALTNAATRPRLTHHDPDHPPAHRLSAHSALSAHVFPKALPPRRLPRRQTTTITPIMRMSSPPAVVEDTGLCGLRLSRSLRDDQEYAQASS
jgi:hypothetical protein